MEVMVFHNSVRYGKTYRLYHEPPIEPLCFASLGG